MRLPHAAGRPPQPRASSTTLHTRPAGGCTAAVRVRRLAARQLAVRRRRRRRVWRWRVRCVSARLPHHCTPQVRCCGQRCAMRWHARCGALARQRLPPCPAAATLCWLCSYAPGEQVYLCYGCHPNQELMELYGFVLRGNPHDTAHLPPELLQRALQQQRVEEWQRSQGARQWRRQQLPQRQANGRAPQEQQHCDVQLGVKAADCHLHHDGAPSWQLLMALRRAPGVACSLLLHCMRSWPPTACCCTDRYSAGWRRPRLQTPTREATSHAVVAPCQCRVRLQPCAACRRHAARPWRSCQAACGRTRSCLCS